MKLLPLLATLFIGLKLLNYISWSWWLVLLPVYGPLAIGLFIVLLAGVFTSGR